MKKLLLLLIGINLIISSISTNAQCPGTWSNSPTLNYQCANGPYLQFDYGPNICPSIKQATYTFTSPVQNVEFSFSAFGTLGQYGLSRMAVFLNDSLIDLNLACDIVLGCQAAAGAYNVNSGCLVDNTSGTDGGISGFIYLSAASFGLPSITSISVSVSEPSSSGSIFEIISCNECPPPSAIEEHTTNKKLLRTIDILGRETKNQPLFYIYDDGTVEKRIIIE